jgi:hypothetical protein
MKRTKHIVSTWRKTNAHKNLVRKPLGRPRKKWGDNIKMGSEE